MALNPEYEKIGYDIIGAAFDVRNTVGRSMRETYYEAALAWELTQRGYQAERQVFIPALYKGVVVDAPYKADIVVDNRVIIEVKALGKMMQAEPRQLITYLSLSNFKLGYLINFGAKDFTTGNLTDQFPYENGIYRIVHGI